MTGHWPYIIAAYAVAGAIVLAMIVWTASEYRAVSRKLAELEARGVRRRGPAAS